MLLGNEGADMGPDMTNAGATLAWPSEPPMASANPHSLSSSPREALNSHLVSQLAAAKPVRRLLSAPHSTRPPSKMAP